MKKTYVIATVMLLLAALIAGCGSKATPSEEGAQESGGAKKKTIVLATSGVSNPFTYQKDGELTGYDVEVVKAIFEGLPDYELKVEVTEFESILNGLDNDRYQLGVNNFSSNSERREKYLFSYPIIENANVFVVRKDDEKLKALEDLGGYKAITEVGNSGATILENYNKEHADNPVEIIYTEENFIKQFENIEAGKYDVRIISRISAEKGIAEYGLTGLKVVPFSNANSDPGSYILFSKTVDSKLYDAVNRRIKEMYDDGTLQKISEEQLGGNYIPKKELLVTE